MPTISYAEAVKRLPTLTEALNDVQGEIAHCFANGYSADNLGTLIVNLKIAADRAERIRNGLLNV